MVDRCQGGMIPPISGQSPANEQWIGRFYSKISVGVSLIFEPGVPAVLAPHHPPVWARVNKPSGDTPLIILTASAFFEMGTPTTRLKMMMDPEMNAGLTDAETQIGMHLLLQPICTTSLRLFRRLFLGA